jgi:hypothetical protein
MDYQRMRIGTKREAPVFLPGIQSGAFAGIVMALLLMLVSAAKGLGFWQPLSAIAASVLGVEALVAGPGGAFLGFALLLIVSAILGVLFWAILRPSTSSSAAVSWGVLYGVVIWAVMTYGVVPSADSTMRARLALMPGWWFACVLVYGACLGWAPGMRQRRVSVLPPRTPTPHIPAEM